MKRRCRSLVPTIYSWFCPNNRTNLSSLLQFVRSHRQAPNSFSGSGKDGICDSGSDRWHSGFTYAAVILVARHDVNFDARHFVDPQYRVVMIVALLNPSFLDRNPLL